MTLRLIMNPTSRSGRGRRRWAAWEKALKQSGADFECCVTSGPGDAAQLVGNANPGDTVVAVGGDGTISEVIDGMVRSGIPDLKLGILYAGTSPDFCRFHHIPVEPDAALQTLLQGNAQPIDVVQIDYAVADGRDSRPYPTTAVFGCGSNIGLGAAAADFANRHRRYFGDTLGTGLGVINAIAKSSPVDMTLEIDGEEIQLPKVRHLAILKNPHIASGLKLNLDLRPDDGQLVAAAIHGVNRRSLIRLLPGFYSGAAAESPSVFIRRAAHIRVHAPSPVSVEFDGDARGFLPAELHLLPKAIHLIGASHD